jgi:hypothetical protein
MFNLGLGDQRKGGSLLDTILQLAIPAYGLMRNAQGLFDPEHREGTMTGWGMNKLEQPGGFFGSDQPQGEGLLGSDFVGGDNGGGYGYDTYNYGNEDIGVESTAYDGMSQSDIDDYGDQVSEF